MYCSLVNQLSTIVSWTCLIPVYLIHFCSEVLQYVKLGSWRNKNIEIKFESFHQSSTEQAEWTGHHSGCPSIEWEVDDESVPGQGRFRKTRTVGAPACESHKSRYCYRKLEEPNLTLRSTLLPSMCNLGYCSLGLLVVYHYMFRPNWPSDTMSIVRTHRKQKHFNPCFTHGAEPFLRSRQLCRHSRTS
jgi:hypothetical protein